MKINILDQIKSDWFSAGLIALSIIAVAAPGLLCAVLLLIASALCCAGAVMSLGAFRWGSMHKGDAVLLRWSVLLFSASICFLYAGYDLV
jgi:hypothetical protein|tara:strand:+ start:3011 stop:3280 length:270 start_codon:yes stop_codon:yes gene_type:complete